MNYQVCWLICQLLKKISFCLSPKNGSHKPKSFKLLASCLPFVPIDPEKLMDEVVLLNLETVVNEEQADVYWAQLQNFKTIEGKQKYPNIYMLAKAALSLSHGNAEVERGFSKSSRILTEDRSSMSVLSLNAMLNVADKLKLLGNKPHLVPISKELLGLSRVAYKSYNDHLEKVRAAAKRNEKERKEAEELAEMEKEKEKILAENRKDMAQLQAARGSEEIQTSAVDELIHEANSKLKKALQKKDLVGEQVAQAMLDGAVKNSAKRKEKRKAVASLERKIDKKRDLITNFFSKKP